MGSFSALGSPKELLHALGAALETSDPLLEPGLLLMFFLPL